MSRRAVIVSTARTGLAKSFRGGFNNTHGASLGGHAIKSAIAKAGIDAGEIEDAFLVAECRKARPNEYRKERGARWRLPGHNKRHHN